MIDPAALGTLRLGLDAIEGHPHSERRTALTRTRAARPSIRFLFAGWLRRAADLLEPRAVEEHRQPV